MSDPESTPPAGAAPEATPTPETPSVPAESRAPESRPAWLPKKFKTPEEMARSYSELEKRMATTKPTFRVEAAQPSASKPDTGQASEAKPATDALAEPQQAAAEQAAIAKVERAGLNVADFHQEFQQRGKLSDQSYDRLKEVGIPREYVDAYIAGQQAVAERTMNEMTQPVGGREAYAQMAQWAAANVPKGELDAYNRIVSGSDRDAARIAIRDLHSRFSKDQEPSFFRSGERVTRGGDVFRSSAEVTAAIRDPRYKSDDAYRREVEQKIGRSNI